MDIIFLEQKEINKVIYKKGEGLKVGDSLGNRLINNGTAKLKKIIKKGTKDGN